MLKEIFIIGIGGQGALTLGELLCHAGNRKNYTVSLYPFYGSQMRGGEAGCVVKLDTEGGEIANPTISEPDDFLILSGKFFEKYRRFAHAESAFYTAPEVNDRNLNLILLKQYLHQTGLFTDEDIAGAIRDKFPRREVSDKKIAAYLDIEISRDASPDSIRKQKEGKEA